VTAADVDALLLTLRLAAVSTVVLLAPPGTLEPLAGLEPGETIALDPVAAGVYVKERAAAGN